MSGPSILFAGDDAWRVGTVQDGRARVEAFAPAQEGATLEARAQAVGQQLAAQANERRPVILAPPSPWCLSATLATDGLERGGRRQAMGFRLEEHLPISAEEVVADYVDTGGGEAMGVCGELEKLREAVRALEAAGLDVRHICPAALLAAAYAAERHPQAGAVLIIGDGRDAPAAYDLVELKKGKPARWWWFANDGPAARDRLSAWAAAQDAPAALVVVGQGDPSHVLPPERAGFGPVEVEELGADHAAALHAAKVLAGAASPWTDLRRDALAAPDRYQAYRKPIGALAAGVMLLLVSVSGAMQWRGRQYEALGRRYLREQADVFKAALPDQRVPASIKGRLLSERRRLEGIGGQAAGDALAAIKPVSALAQLRGVLGSLPADLRYRILDLSIQPDLVRVDGQARGHGEAERLATALRRSAAYDVEDPKTQALKEGGVSFLFTAKPRAAAPRGAE